MMACAAFTGSHAIASADWVSDRPAKSVRNAPGSTWSRRYTWAQAPGARHLKFGISFGFTRADELGQVITSLENEVLPATADERIRAVSDQVLLFDRAVGAADRMRSGEAIGKIALSMEM